MWRNRKPADHHRTIAQTTHSLGPLLRAAHWEATAATELRNHAEHLARHLVTSGD